MKKFLTAITAVIYLGISTGMSLHLHYCMGEMVNISLSETKAELCVKCGMKESKSSEGCCSDVQFTVKSSEKHFAPDEAVIYPCHINEDNHTFFAVQHALHIPVRDMSPEQYVIPPGSKPIYIQYHRLLI